MLVVTKQPIVRQHPLLLLAAGLAQPSTEQHRRSPKLAIIFALSYFEHIQ